MARRDKGDHSRTLEDDAPFEAVIERIESIVHQLEASELPLETSLAAFEEAIALSRRASKTLDAMEGRIQLLTQEGSLEPLPVANAATDDSEE